MIRSIARVSMLIATFMAIVGNLSTTSAASAQSNRVTVICTWPSNPPNLKTFTFDLAQKTVAEEDSGMSGIFNGTIMQITDQTITWQMATTNGNAPTDTETLNRYTLQLNFSNGLSESCELKQRQL